MSRHRSISSTTDKRAVTRAYVVGLILCLAAYGMFVAACTLALELGWHA